MTQAVEKGGQDADEAAALALADDLVGHRVYLGFLSKGRTSHCCTRPSTLRQLVHEQSIGALVTNGQPKLIAQGLRGLDRINDGMLITAGSPRRLSSRTVVSRLHKLASTVVRGGEHPRDSTVHQDVWFRSTCCEDSDDEATCLSIGSEATLASPVVDSSLVCSVLNTPSEWSCRLANSPSPAPSLSASPHGQLNNFTPSWSCVQQPPELEETKVVAEQRCLWKSPECVSFARAAESPCRNHDHREEPNDMA
eukprot:COSAG02_NODE_16123_length_1111_cov_1.314229_1_plen_251_part_10